MSSWSKRRKISYVSIVVVVVIVPVSLLAFHTFYKAPTCFDGLKNGSEQGVDCGGSCQKLCASAFLPPKLDWARYEEIAPGIYNLAAYIENPNTDVGASNVPFHMVLYDSVGVPVVDTAGTMILPPHRNTLAFLPAVKIGQSRPATVPLFEFTAGPEWIREADPLANLVVGDQNYSEGVGGSSLQVSLKNNGVQPIPPLHVYVVLYDKDKNVLGFSKTVLDGIPGNGSVVAPFTWPSSFNGQVISQEILPVAE
jgi:hypothetical protein